MPKSNLLEAMHARAERSLSARILIAREGHVLYDYHDGKSDLVEIMSITKSITALAIFHLWAQKAFKDLHMPLAEVFPTWKHPPYDQITLYHVLTHTSGLDHDPTCGDLIHCQDYLAYALTAPVIAPPGTLFSYNNRASALLAAFVEHISGLDLETYVARHIFAPLHITRWGWNRDPSGLPKALGGVQMHASDLLKIGEVTRAHGAPLLPPQTFQDMILPTAISNHTCGALWWKRSTPLPMLYAHGYLGQWMLILPTSQTVAIRQLPSKLTPPEEADTFIDFPVWVEAFLHSPAAQNVHSIAPLTR